MRAFFAQLGRHDRAVPEQVAKRYASHFWDRAHGTLRDQDQIASSPFHVGLGVRDGDFHTLTKRVALVTDSLVLSNHWRGTYHEVGAYRSDHYGLAPEAVMRMVSREHTEGSYGITTPDLGELGRWITAAEPLLRAGLVWYLPSYSTVRRTEVDGRRWPPVSVRQKDIVDLFVTGRRAVDASGVNPFTSRFVRAILEIDLPFVDGVGLRDFGRITVDEFDSYRAFRDFARLKFLDLDQAMDSVQSQRELLRIGLEIRDQVRASHAEMARVRTTRAVAAGGAVIGTVGAALVAVYGPAIQPALATLGATGGLWGIVHAATGNSVRSLREGTPWYYVWALTRAAGRNGLR